MMMKAGNLFNVNGSIEVLGACALSLCVASFSNADVCTDPQTAVEYDSSDGDEPDVATPSWDTDCIGDQDGDTTLASIVDGKLYIKDDDINAKAKYCHADLFDDSCDPRQDAVYEFSCKALSVDTNSDAWSASGALSVFTCGMGTGTDTSDDYDLRLAITLNEGVGFFEVDGDDANWLEVGGKEQHVDIDQTIPLDPTSPWTQAHIFKVVKDGDYVKLYVDNESSPSLRFLLTDLADNYLQDETKLLTTSKPGESEFELMHFRYRIAATNFNTFSPAGCVGDIDEDDDVDADDLLLLLAAWGPCTGCDEDMDNDDKVGTSDLLILLSNWGDCP